MKKLIQIALLISSSSLFAQQIVIPRIEMMPDFPQPYEMRNWKRVAQAYDSLVFNEFLSGQYLPLIKITEQTINYPDHPSFGLHSYVGTATPSSGEAINVLPSVIGATLCGIDKGNQFGKNWVLFCEEYFNKVSGEDVYLNHPSAQSGHDWWYETMPNIFFYQLNSLYPHTGDFDAQFTSVARSWLEAVKAMGGNDTPWEVPEMNYRAWNLRMMKPLTEGVPEPEAAGALAWILYSAYQQTGNIAWREAAEWSMEYLNGLETNPSYELQLSYGTYTAARMNAEMGTTYDVEKMVNWCFDIGSLRNWGAIEGTWGGLDCDGLIGEQSAGGTGYAFTMNGFQQAAALLPLVRYDDRYAQALGKWTLNLANASRLFYANYLPDENQDARDWTSLHDPGSAIAYEALKETLDGRAPFATGDAVRGGWAATNLALYGSSHVGMLGGIVSSTNVEGILQLDLLKTDFYRNEAFSTYLYYNPHTSSQEVQLDLGGNSYDIYECTTNQFLTYNQTGQYLLSMPPGQARVLVLVSAGLEISYSFDHTYAGGVVIDYLNGRVVENFPPRIKSLAAADSVVLVNSEHNIYCTAEDREGGALQYRWSGEGENWVSDNIYLWEAPETPGYYNVICYVKDAGGLMDSMKLAMHVADRILAPPVIEQIYAEERKLHPGTTTVVSCEATDINNDLLQYEWYSSGGSIEGEGASVSWLAPGIEGDYSIRCKVINDDLLHVSDSLTVMVRDSSYSQSGSLVAGFSFNGNGDDFSIYLNHGIPYSITWENDSNGEPGKAAGFNGTNSMIRVSNDEYLNFTDGLSVTCWINPKESVTGEQFIVSHGSWQNRWKLSIINNDRLRFTIKGSSGIVDLNSERELQPGSWQHVAAVYNGRDLEIYLDSDLNSFKPWTGTLNTTSYDLTIGQMLPDNSSYNFKGVLDDLRIFNYGIDGQMIEKIWSGEIFFEEDVVDRNRFTIFPNPARSSVIITVTAYDFTPDKIWLTGGDGRVLWSCDMPERYYQNDRLTIPLGHMNAGIYFICVIEKGKLYTEKLVIF